MRTPSEDWRHGPGDGGYLTTQEQEIQHAGHALAAKTLKRYGTAPEAARSLMCGVWRTEPDAYEKAIADVALTLILHEMNTEEIVAFRAWRNQPSDDDARYDTDAPFPFSH